jgi:hypothetical protein
MALVVGVAEAGGAAGAEAADANGDGDRFEMLGGVIVFACSDLSPRIAAGASAFAAGGG